MRPTYIREGNLLYLVYQFKCYVLMCSVMADSLQTHHVPLSLEFSRQEYWSGFPFPSPGNSNVNLNPKYSYRNMQNNPWWNIWAPQSNWHITINQPRNLWLEDVLAEQVLEESLSDHPILKGRVTLAEVRTGCKLDVLELCPIQRCIVDGLCCTL